jgi:hypothetical protein
MRASVLAMVIAGALAVVGCGGDDEDGGSGSFVGTWKYTSGTETSNCGGQSSTDMLMGNVTINKGISSPLILVDGNCSLLLDVNGSTASARPSQECVGISGGNSVTLKVTAYTFTVNGTIATESQSATAQVATPGGSVACTYTASGMLMKISQ